MARLLTSIAISLGRGAVFTQLTRFVNPELLSAGVFASGLFASDLLGPETTKGVANGILIEFLMLHANVGIGVATLFSPTATARRAMVVMTGGFYFLFVIAMALGMGAWWMMFCFLLLLWSRLNEPLKDGGKSMKKEIVIGMLRFFIYLFTVAAVAGILIGLGNDDDEITMLAWGMCYFLVLFLLRKKIERLRESKIFK